MNILTLKWAFNKEIGKLFTWGELQTRKPYDKNVMAYLPKVQPIADTYASALAEGYKKKFSLDTVFTKTPEDVAGFGCKIQFMANDRGDLELVISEFDNMKSEFSRAMIGVYRAAFSGLVRHLQTSHGDKKPEDLV